MVDRLEKLRTAIAENAVPGGSAYGRTAAEVIALTLQGSRAQGQELASLLRSTADWLIQTKPSMASMRRVVKLALDALETSGSREAVIEAMRQFIAHSEAAIARIADYADTYIKPGSKVLFHSYSGSLIQILGRAANTSAGLLFMFTESRPYRESRRVVAHLADTPVRFEGYSDAAMAAAVARADLVLVGADTLLRDGSFVNKIGSLPLALSCQYIGTPYYVVTEVSKLYPGDPDDVAMEQRPAYEMADEWDLWRSGRVEINNQFFERVPATLVSTYLTDEGALAPNEIAGLRLRDPA